MEVWAGRPPGGSDVANVSSLFNPAVDADVDLVEVEVLTSPPATVFEHNAVAGAAIAVSRHQGHSGRRGVHGCACWRCQVDAPVHATATGADRIPSDTEWAAHLKIVHRNDETLIAGRQVFTIVTFVLKDDDSDVPGYGLIIIRP